jgi:hypothetical protein
MTLTKEQKDFLFDILLEKRNKAIDDALYYNSLLASAKALNVDVDKYDVLSKQNYNTYRTCAELIDRVMEE